MQLCISQKKKIEVYLFLALSKKHTIYIKQKNIFLTAISDIVGGIKEHNVI